MRAEQNAVGIINNQLAKLQRNYTMMVGLVLLFICVVVWMLLSISQTSDTSELSSTARKYTTELNPNLDLDTMKTVATKKHYDESELTNFPILIMVESKEGGYVVLPIDTPAEEISLIKNGSSTRSSRVTPTPIASRSAQPTQTLNAPSATASPAASTPTPVVQASAAASVQE